MDTTARTAGASIARRTVRVHFSAFGSADVLVGMTSSVWSEGLAIRSQSVLAEGTRVAGRIYARDGRSAPFVGTILSARPWSPRSGQLSGEMVIDLGPGGAAVYRLLERGSAVGVRRIPLPTEALRIVAEDPSRPGAEAAPDDAAAEWCESTRNDQTRPERPRAALGASVPSRRCA